MWGQNTRVVIIPSFLAIAYISWALEKSSEGSIGANSEAGLGICKTTFETNDLNKFCYFHGREYPGDGIDCVQDPQGVPKN